VEDRPVQPVLKNGVLYGRGTSDMKGGVASAVYAGALLKKAGFPKDVTLYVTGTVQEEDCDGLCWQYIVKEDKLRPHVVVITEPTSLRIYRGPPRPHGDRNRYHRHLVPRLGPRARRERDLQDGAHHQRTSRS
jgi:acetylornithine deacetylase/succinyl-diaminopimelate desuccinylase-like protein